ncbi:MAG: hypothetical protein IT291_06370 [Deltaproteobacteria bacterium]|nr:hypothetical protein [Deltaproteobacteria bacterium]
MAFLELTLYSFFLFAIFLFLFIPAGALVAEKLLSSESVNIRLLAAVAVSLVLYSGLIAILLLFGASPLFLGIALMAMSSVCFGCWLRAGLYRMLFRGEIAQGILILGMLFFSSQVTLSFPDGDIRKASPVSTMLTTNLPVDVLISYNFSRYLLEDIDFDSLEVVPTWQSLSRGPVAGILTAGVLAMLGLEETSPWLLVSGVPFFVYQALLAFLNILAVFAVWNLSVNYFNVVSARYATALMSSTYFFFINSIFAWPKFLMGFFVAVAIAVFRTGKHPMLTGILLGAAFLSHDSGLFAIASFFSLQFCSAVFSKLRGVKLGDVSLRNAFIAILGDIVPTILSFVGTVLPWFLLKLNSAQQSTRGIYYLLFCYFGMDADTLPLRSVLKWYLEQQSFAEMLSARMSNLFYPFDLESLLTAVRSYWLEPLKLINHIGTASFYGFFVSLGLIFVGLLFYGFAKNFSNKNMLFVFGVSFGSLLFASLATACSSATVNHIWVYPAFICAAIYAGAGVYSLGKLGAILCGVGIGINLASSFVAYQYHSIGRVYLHASDVYSCLQIGAMLFACACCLLPVRFSGTWGLKLSA